MKPHPPVPPLRIIALTLAAALLLGVPPTPVLGGAAPAPRAASAASARRDPCPCAAPPALAAAASGRAAPGPRAALPAFPLPLSWAIAAALLCGALGALAGDLVADGRRIDGSPPRRTSAVLGLAGRMLVGMVAALFVLSLLPPDRSWVKLVSVSLGGGVGGEAVLLAILSSRRVVAAEKDREAAEAQTSRGATLAIEKIETFRALTLAAHQAPTPEAATDEGEPPPEERFDRIVNTYADRAKAEIASVVG